MRPISFVDDLLWKDAVKSRKLHLYGSAALETERRNFIANKKQEIPHFAPLYKPTPWFFQYDLEVHSFLNYYRIQKEEIDLLGQALKVAPEGKVQNVLVERLEHVEAKGFSGVPRHEHLLRAIELRWPTEEVDEGIDEGRWEGAMIRNEWLERFCRAVARESYVLMFGGGGQGKTNMALAFTSILWDHFIYTRKGARCPFSTVAESKMVGATWPAVVQLYQRSIKEISLYSGRGRIVGRYTIRRPPLPGERISRDTSGTIMGLLVGGVVDPQKIQDKLTGTHGHPAHIYTIDEIQSTPPGPLNAAPNFQQSSPFRWLIGAGNYGSDEDLLAKNCRPMGGWDTVDEYTPEWDTETELGRKCVVIHYHNDKSPGMEDPKKFWFLPTIEKYRANYPTVMSRNTDDHRRFWKGWRKAGGTDSDTVLDRIMIQANRCTAPITFDRRWPITTFLTFDSAPGERDRNCVGVFQDGVCEDTGIWKFKPIKFYELGRGGSNMERQRHYQRTTQEISNYAQEHEVEKNRGIICDHTQFSAYPEMLADMGWICVLLSFGQMIPDGYTANEFTGEIEEAIVLSSAKNEFLHQKAADRVSGGAKALRTYVEYGRVGNMKDTLILDAAPDDKRPDVDKELYRRTWENQPNKMYGDRFKLGNKKTFHKKFGMSPDWLDVYFMAAWYMIAVRKMIPDDMLRRPPDSSEYTSIEEQMDDLNDVYNDKLIYQ